MSIFLVFVSAGVWFDGAFFPKSILKKQKSVFLLVYGLVVYSTVVSCYSESHSASTKLPNSKDFYKGIFLNVIPFRITDLCSQFTNHCFFTSHSSLLPVCYSLTFTLYKHIYCYDLKMQLKNLFKTSFTP